MRAGFLPNINPNDELSVKGTSRRGLPDPFGVVTRHMLQQRRAKESIPVTTRMGGGWLR
jgi:hypothetical protein